MVTFKPDFLLIPASLDRFMFRNEEVAVILRDGPTPPTAQGHTWSNSYIDLNELYFYVSGFFLSLGSYLLHALCMTDLSKKMWVQSRHTINDATAIKADKIFQNNLLAKSVNTHRLDATNYFLLPPARTTLATHPAGGMVNFFHTGGICRGMCHWFVHLYFKSRGHFSDINQHLRSVGQQFTQGAPNQAALLQSFDLPPVYDLLHLRVQADYSKISVKNKTVEQIIREIQVRPLGVYGIYTSSHQVIYIKIDESRQYLFDPNVGVIRLASPLVFWQAMQTYIETHDPLKEIIVDLYNRS